MKSSALAFTLLTLVGVLAALDLSGAHQLPVERSTNGAVQSHTITVTATDADEDESDTDETEDDVEGRLVQTFLVTQRNATGNSPASSAQLCSDTSPSERKAPAHYCFGSGAQRLTFN